MEEFKAQAALHGANLSKTTRTDTQLDELPQQDSDFMFKDPTEYDKMSSEERDTLTKKMMGMHKKWYTKGALATGTGE